MREENRHSLKDGLKKLSEHRPSESIWSRIEHDLNDDVLQVGLDQLVGFKPNENSWDSIESALSINEAIETLVQKTPSEEIWVNIESELHSSPIISFKTRIIKSRYWLSGVAAALLIGFFIYPLLQNKESISISYSEEIIEKSEVNDWLRETDELEVILQTLCTENPIACKSPEFETLTSELKFLNESKTAVLEQVNEFSDNKGAELMLTKIELERIDIIKRMIAQTIA